MTHTSILTEINLLEPADRLELLTAVLEQLRVELLRQRLPPVAADSNARMKAAADALSLDYTTDRELTAFTTLDGDALHEPR